jgi:hypothetical protein
MRGLKVDPMTNGIAEKDSSFSVRPSQKKGVHFVVGELEIPYNPNTLNAIDGIFGRMLRMSDPE